MSTLKLEKITGQEGLGGAASPITFSGDTVTLGSATTFPPGSIIGWSKSGPLDGASVVASDGEKTIFGSHTHTFKTTNAILMVQCFANVNIYHQANTIKDQRWTGAMRSSADSYGSNLDGSAQQIQVERGASGTGGQTHTGSPFTFTYIATPSRSVGDSHSFKIWQTSSSNVGTVRTNRGTPNAKVTWISYEIAQ